MMLWHGSDCYEDLTVNPDLIAQFSCSFKLKDLGCLVHFFFEAYNLGGDLMRISRNALRFKLFIFAFCFCSSLAFAVIFQNGI